MDDLKINKEIRIIKYILEHFQYPAQDLELLFSVVNRTREIELSSETTFESISGTEKVRCTYLHHLQWVLYILCSPQVLVCALTA